MSEYDALKGSLKTKLRERSASQSLPPGTHQASLICLQYLVILILSHIQVTVEYEKPVHHYVSASLRPTALALYRGKWQSLAHAVMKCREVSFIIVDLVLKQQQDECERHCSSSRKGMLRKASPEDLQSFSSVALASELKWKAPLFSVLCAAGAPHRPRNIHKGTTGTPPFVQQLCTEGEV